MIVLQGTTPQEVKDSILELLKMEAERHCQSAKNSRLQKDKACDMARANALRSVASLLRDCLLTDLTNKGK